MNFGQKPGMKKGLPVELRDSKERIASPPVDPSCELLSFS